MLGIFCFISEHALPFQIPAGAEMEGLFDFPYKTGPFEYSKLIAQTGNPRTPVTRGF